MLIGPWSCSALIDGALSQWNRCPPESYSQELKVTESKLSVQTWPMSGDIMGRECIELSHQASCCSCESGGCEDLIRMLAALIGDCQPSAALIATEVEVISTFICLPCPCFKGRFGG